MARVRDNAPSGDLVIEEAMNRVGRLSNRGLRSRSGRLARPAEPGVRRQPFEADGSSTSPVSSKECPGLRPTVYD